MTVTLTEECFEWVVKAREHSEQGAYPEQGAFHLPPRIKSSWHGEVSTRIQPSMSLSTIFPTHIEDTAVHVIVDHIPDSHLFKSAFIPVKGDNTDI